MFLQAFKCGRLHFVGHSLMLPCLHTGISPFSIRYDPYSCMILSWSILTSLSSFQPPLLPCFFHAKYLSQLEVKVEKETYGYSVIPVSMWRPLFTKSIHHNNGLFLHALVQVEGGIQSIIGHGQKLAKDAWFTHIIIDHSHCHFGRSSPTATFLSTPFHFYCLLKAFL